MNGRLRLVTMLQRQTYQPVRNSMSLLLSLLVLLLLLLLVFATEETEICDLQYEPLTNYERNLIVLVKSSTPHALRRHKDFIRRIDGPSVLGGTAYISALASLRLYFL